MVQRIKTGPEDGRRDGAKNQKRKIGNSLFQCGPQADDQRHRAANHDQAGQDFAPHNVAFLHERAQHLRYRATRRPGLGGLHLLDHDEARHDLDASVRLVGNNLGLAGATLEPIRNAVLLFFGYLADVFANLDELVGLLLKRNDRSTCYRRRFRQRDDRQHIGDRPHRFGNGHARQGFEATRHASQSPFDAGGLCHVLLTELPELPYGGSQFPDLGYP